jgi:uncharacterized surface protein with fasciclin (FAS1) repeats
MKSFVLSILTLCLLLTGTTLMAQCSGSKSETKAVSTQYANDKGDVVDIAISSPDHTTLVAAVKAAGLVETLKSEGPFTVFAPVNSGFEALPAGTVEALLKPENKGQLTSVLTYHVLAGNFASTDVLNAINNSDGTASFTTVQGGTIKAMVKDGKVVLMDENGRQAVVTAVDLEGSNGTVHVIDQVVLPQMK